MPPYPGVQGATVPVKSNACPLVLTPGDSCYMFGVLASTATQLPVNDTNVAFETVTAGERSISIQLAPRAGGGAPPGIMVQVIANANPGAAEIDVQDAAVDADGCYLTNTSSTAYKLTTWTQLGSTGTYVAWTELQPEGAQFISLLCVANPNAVKFTAKAVYV